MKSTVRWVSPQAKEEIKTGLRKSLDQQQTQRLPWVPTLIKVQLHQRWFVFCLPTKDDRGG